MVKYVLPDLPYDFGALEPHISARIMELHHLTPGNKRGFIQARMRNIRTSALADQKFRAEEDLERATLDEREMQYLYNDGDHYYFMDTSSFEQVQISLEALGDSKDYLIPDAVIKVEFYDVEPVGIEGLAVAGIANLVRCLAVEPLGKCSTERLINVQHEEHGQRQSPGQRS